MKPSKLIRHIETKPSVLKDKLLQFFKRKKCEQEEQKQLLKATTSSNVSALKASFLVPNHMLELRRVGEELILPTAKDICQELLGEAAVQKVARVPLSASTITRRSDEIAEGIEAQLSELNESRWYAIEADTQCRDPTRLSCGSIGRQILYHWATWEALRVPTTWG